MRDKLKITMTMIFRMLVRQKIVLVLIFLIPLFFFSLIQITSSEMFLPVTLASLENEEVILIPERQITLIYYAIASCGFLVSFLALYLVQQNSIANKRLFICGYSPVYFILAVMLSLLIIVIIIASYVGLLVQLFHKFSNIPGLIIGLTMIGLVYGCYGLFAGSLLRRELEGILMIVLLANIDVGWLQKPVFYSQSENKEFIQLLPGFYPSQTSIIQVFSEYSSLNSILYSIVYALLFLCIALLIFYNKMRIRRYHFH